MRKYRKSTIQRFDDLIHRNHRDFKNCWIPIPVKSADKWDEERVRVHLQNGFPIYLRLAHSEEVFYKYNNIDDAIFPSRVNVNPNTSYNPQTAQDVFYKYRYSMLPEDTRFSAETAERITEIQNHNHISEPEAVFQYAQKNLKLNFPMYNLNFAGDLIFGDILSLHSHGSTNCTPFKGMLGGTLSDPYLSMK